MQIYAHRGASGTAPENTLAAFIQAVQFNADGVEVDIQLSRDGHPVICHDHTIDRTSNGQGRIADLTLSELRRYDFGSWFGEQYREQKILTLTEFMTWFSATGLLLNIEIKNGPVIYQEIEEKTVAILRRFGAIDRTIVSSFFHPSLVLLKQLEPAIKTGALFECRPVDPLQFIASTGADYLHPCWQSLDENWCPAAIAAGIKLHAYTIDTAKEYQFASTCGVSAIFTNFPGRLRKISSPAGLR